MTTFNKEIQGSPSDPRFDKRRKRLALLNLSGKWRNITLKIANTIFCEFLYVILPLLEYLTTVCQNFVIILYYHFYFFVIILYHHFRMLSLLLSFVLIFMYAIIFLIIFWFYNCCYHFICSIGCDNFRLLFFVENLKHSELLYLAVNALVY
jgi:hypothetical protein